MNTEQYQLLTERCFQMKAKALEMALGTGSNGSHIGGAFSAMEILAVLYEIAKVNMDYEARDRVIVSKGHSVLAYYTALWQKGLITEADLDTFNKNGTHFHGHPQRQLEYGIEFSGGSLGLGLSYSVGVALACKRKGFKNRIFCLVGDGECDEGIVWEALMSISNYGFDNMTIIIDKNGYQVDGPTSEVMELHSLEEKFTSFGFNVKSVNGHSVSDLYETLASNIQQSYIIIAETVKANGISFLENNKISHMTSLSQKKYNQALEELKIAYGKL